MPDTPNYSPDRLRHIIEAALLAAGEPLSVAQLAELFDGEQGGPSQTDLVKAIEALQEQCSDRGIELRKVSSGYRLQVKQEFQEWISRLWSERPKRYSRALLETLALVAYRQPITRGEIEDVRGVSLSSNIIRTLQERDWIRVVGHRDVPGKPALFGTTRAFLDYFDLESLDELPTLAEIKDMDTLEPELDLEPRLADPEDAESGEDEADVHADAKEVGSEAHDPEVPGPDDDLEDDDLEDEDLEDEDLEDDDLEDDDLEDDDLDDDDDSGRVNKSA